MMRIDAMILLLRDAVLSRRQCRRKRNIRHAKSGKHATLIASMPVVHALRGP